MSAADPTIELLPADCVEVAARHGQEAWVQARLPIDAIPLAPARWLVVTEAAAPGRSAQGLTHVLGAHAAVIDQSSGLVRLRLTGQRARGVLAKLCRLDLAAMEPGRAARTVMAQVPVIIRLLDDTPSFDLLVPSTLARSFRHHLARAVESMER